MKTELLDKNKTYLNIGVHLKIWNKIDSLAKSKGMTRKGFITWSDAEYYRTNISDYEFNLIYSYQVSKAIERLGASGKDMLVGKTENEYYWIDRFKNDFYKVDKVIKHLIDICGYVKRKEGKEYNYKWLLDYDDILFDRIIEESRGNNKRGRLVRSD